MKIGNKGQALTEYILIVTLISIIVIIAVNILGGYVMDAFTKIGCEMTNKEYIEGSKPGEGHCNETIE